MSRATQIARAQRRALRQLKADLPATIQIEGEDYEVALTTGTSDADSADGNRTEAESITFWLSKTDHPTEPSLRRRVIFEDEPHFITFVDGRGDNFQGWEVTASRHGG